MGTFSIIFCLIFLPILLDKLINIMVLLVIYPGKSGHYHTINMSIKLLTKRL
jgi:hypothetical protein